MKKTILYSILLLYFGSMAHAQCSLNNTATDPNPTYTQPSQSVSSANGTPYMTNTFNWWNEGYNQVGPINTNITGFPAQPSGASVFHSCPHYAECKHE